MDAPTGSGKSWIAYQAGTFLNNYYDITTLVLTKTIILQNQYIETFKDMKKLMGASNYKCNSKNILPIPISNKYHENCKYSKKSNKCLYEKARREYRTSEFKNLNYAFYITGLSIYKNDGFLVIDEAHNLEEYLLELVTLKLCIEDLDKEKIGDVKLKEYWDKHYKYDISNLSYKDCNSIFTFASKKKEEILDNINIIEENIKNIEKNYRDDQEYSDEDFKLITEYIEKKKKLSERFSKYRKICFCFYYISISDDFKKEWVISKDYSSNKANLMIKPIEVPNNLINYIFSDCKKVLLMSATALRIKKSLKIKEDECEIIKVPYIFDLEKRPIYSISSLPVFSKNTRENVLPKYLQFIDEIVSSYTDKTNFLIHSVSYDNAKFIQKNSKFYSRIFIPTSLQIRNIKKYIKKGTITISPSMLEGIDMPEGLAKVQIFLKIPFPFLGDPWIVKKKENDIEWYKYKAMADIIQGSGRGIRRESDECDTFILDPLFKNLYNSILDLIPDWWKETINFM